MLRVHARCQFFQKRIPSRQSGIFVACYYKLTNIVFMKYFLLLLATSALLATTSCSKDDVTPDTPTDLSRLSNKPVKTSAYGETNYGIYAPNPDEPEGRVLFHFRHTGKPALMQVAYRLYQGTTFEALGGFTYKQLQTNADELTGINNRPLQPITASSDLRVRIYRDNAFIGEWSIQTGDQIKNPLAD